MAYQTIDGCETARGGCPGRQAVPLRILVPILLAVFAVLVASHVMLTAAIAEMWGVDL